MSVKDGYQIMIMSSHAPTQLPFPSLNNFTVSQEKLTPSVISARQSHSNCILPPAMAMCPRWFTISVSHPPVQHLLQLSATFQTDIRLYLVVLQPYVFFVEADHWSDQTGETGSQFSFTLPYSLTGAIAIHAHAYPMLFCCNVPHLHARRKLAPSGSILQQPGSRICHDAVRGDTQPWAVCCLAHHITSPQVC